MPTRADLHLWHAPGMILGPTGVPNQYLVHASACDGPRALTLTHYDPGAAAYRYHSAFNASGGGVSAFARFGDGNPSTSLRQWDGMRDRAEVTQLFEQADVVHVHMDYETIRPGDFLGHITQDQSVRSLERWPDPSRQLLVRHYHGSHPNPSDPAAPPLVDHAEDDRLGAVHVGARLYHQRFSPRMHWLPIPVPVKDYAALAQQHFVYPSKREHDRLRVAHSPTNPRIKGTMALDVAVRDVAAKGLPIELVMIQGKTHAEALALKATCDVTFDSFWLGIQGSGLEGAAMGQVVIAGDPEVKAEYEASEVGHCPYTYARDYEELKPVLERLVVDREFRRAERTRVVEYVCRYHDYVAVGRRYWDIIARERAARGLIPNDTRTLAPEALRSGGPTGAEWWS